MKTNRKSTVALRSILVPIDFSAESKKALAYAVPFARKFGARISLVHVIEPVATPDFAESFPLMVPDDKLMSAARTELQRVKRQFRIDSKMLDQASVRFGRAFHEIVGMAKARKCDLIIIATHGYTGLKHALMGSTAERVVRHAHCPVLVVRKH